MNILTLDEFVKKRVLLDLMCLKHFVQTVTSLEATGIQKKDRPLVHEFKSLLSHVLVA